MKRLTAFPLFFMVMLGYASLSFAEVLPDTNNNPNNSANDFNANPNKHPHHHHHHDWNGTKSWTQGDTPAYGQEGTRRHWQGSDQGQNQNQNQNQNQGSGPVWR